MAITIGTPTNLNAFNNNNPNLGRTLQNRSRPNVGVQGAFSYAPVRAVVSTGTATAADTATLTLSDRTYLVGISSNVGGGVIFTRVAYPGDATTLSATNFMSTVAANETVFIYVSPGMTLQFLAGTGVASGVVSITEYGLRGIQQNSVLA